MKLWLLSKAILATMSGFLSYGDFADSDSDINHPPSVKQRTPDPETISTWSEYEIDAKDVFSDADGDELVYSALSQSQTMAKVKVEGSTIKVMAEKAGKVTIIVTASDQRGGSASIAYRFDVTE